MVRNVRDVVCEEGTVVCFLRSSILLWDPPEGLNPTQALEYLQKRLDILGGKALGTWSIDCETLQSTPQLSECCGSYVYNQIHAWFFVRSTRIFSSPFAYVLHNNSPKLIIVH